MGKTVLKFFLVLASLLSAFILNAQAGSCVQLDVVSDQSISFEVLSVVAPSLGDYPDFGEVTWEESAPFSYEVTYTPDPGFGADAGGEDDFTLAVFPLSGGFQILCYEVDVTPAIIKAEHDIALTTEGLPVFLEVLDNDFSSVGYFDLESVSVTNNGTTEIVGDNILFTPRPGFSGLTDLDYVICVMGVCDVGTVSINVLSEDLSFPADTVSLFSKRTGEAFILVPESYNLVEPPQHGTYDDSQEVPVYIPNGNYVGEDYLVFSHQAGEQIVFEVQVLDLIDNSFTTEDQYQTIANSELLLRPLYNDTYGNLAGCVSYGLPQYGTLMPTALPAEMIYQPPAGWTGIDRVEYVSYPPGCIGEPETETIYILVSNFEPDAEAVQLTLSAGGEVPITYELPIDADVEWEVIELPQVGTVELIDGQLVYQAADQAGTDQLSISYCLRNGTTNDCQVSKTVQIDLTINPASGPLCDDDCVWPGDANADGVVDLGDMLPIGRHMGTYGTARDGDDPAIWCPQSSADWGNDAANGADLKHVDTDGNRFIDHRDTQLVRQNLGLAHQLRPQLPLLESFEVYLEGDIFAEPGEIIALDIVVGSTTAGYVGAEDIYGFRLPFLYDPEFFDPATISAEFHEQAWTSYDSPIISMTDNNEDDGIFEAVYSRTNGLPTSGLGSVGTMYVGAEDIYGFRPGDDPITVTIGGGQATAMTGAGFLGSVNIRPFELTIVPHPEVEEDLSQAELDAELAEDLLTYPNPTAGTINVHLNGGRYFSDLVIADLHGRSIITRHGLDTNHQVLDLSSLPNGIYSLRLTTPEGVVTRKLEVLR